jgi:hypothetical protein
MVVNLVLKFIVITNNTCILKCGKVIKNWIKIQAGGFT